MHGRARSLRGGIKDQSRWLITKRCIVSHISFISGWKSSCSPELCPSKALRSNTMKERIITVMRRRGAPMHSEFITQAAALKAFVRPLEVPPAEQLKVESQQQDPEHRS